MSKVTGITPFHNLDRLRSAWSQLFTSTDPFSDPFHQRVTDHLVFYPTSGYHLTREQFASLVKASQEIGDKGFVVSVVEYAGDFFSRGQHWWCESPSYEAYASLPLVLENALYSLNSTWGVLVSHEDHAVVGGTRDFGGKIRSAYPAWESDLVSLRDVWADNPSRGWLDNTRLSRK